MRWRKVTLAGVGLLGGSLGLALRQRGLAGEVHGYVRREASIAECLEAGAVDRATTSLEAAVKGAELVVLCTPLSKMAGLSAVIAPLLEPGTLATDVGSVKGPLVRELEPIFQKCGAHFIGSHPMAGSERMGVAAARPDLFQNAACIVTPGLGSLPAKVGETEELWRAVGARVSRMSPDRHDQLVARTSHLPHVLAAHLAALVLDPAADAEQPALCANGFRDCTRIASGSPEMWRDIVLMNNGHLGGALDEFIGELSRFRDLLLGSDDDLERADRIKAFFAQAKDWRDHWAARSASPSPE